jgi:hypothetical protein
MAELYEGIPFESDSELYILYWLLELKAKGFIESIERAPEMQLSPGLSNNYTKETVLKTKTKQESKFQSLLEPHFYTPEFKVIWVSPISDKIIWDISKLGTEKCNALIIGKSIQSVRELDEVIQSYLTYIEVKPVHDFHNMTRAFRINQKWMWEKRGIYINLLQPDLLFKSTFTPQTYLHTRKKRTERLIKWPIITCDQYLSSLNQ